jgi:hypothetical protein
VPELRLDQVAPPSALTKIAPGEPTATQTVVVGQLTPAKYRTPATNWLFQLAPPSTVRMTKPLLPTPTHAVALAQLSPSIGETVAACSDQLVPALAVA